MLLADVDLEQLPFLLLLKLHAHKSCAGAAAAAAAAVRHRVPDNAICCCCFTALDSSVFFIICSNTIYLNVPFGSAVACTASIRL